MDCFNIATLGPLRGIDRQALQVSRFVWNKPYPRAPVLVTRGACPILLGSSHAKSKRS